MLDKLVALRERGLLEHCSPGPWRVCRVSTPCSSGVLTCPRTLSHDHMHRAPQVAALPAHEAGLTRGGQIGRPRIALHSISWATPVSSFARNAAMPDANVQDALLCFAAATMRPGVLRLC